jgi:regulator of sigma E protease
LFSTGFANGLWIIPVLGVLIFVHELGHFFAARRCGVKVEEFGIGLPPRLFGWVRNDVIWSINMIPFGGFVRVKGEDADDMSPDSMNAKSPLQRAFFLAAGAGMNVLFAVLLMFIVLGVKGDTHSNVYVSTVMPGSPAAQAGWLAGDRIAEINGDEIESLGQVTTATRSNAGDQMTVTVERRGQLIDTSLTPRENPPEGQGRVGIQMTDRVVGTIIVGEVAPGSPSDVAGLQVDDEFVTINGLAVEDYFVIQSELTRYSGTDAEIVIRRGEDLFTTAMAVPALGPRSDVLAEVGLPVLQALPTFENIPWVEIIPRGFSESYNATKQMLLQLKLMLTDRETLSQVTGPIGMGQVTSQIIEASPLPTWYILAQIAIVLSLNLAVLNLLPLPALDGGRLLFVFIELLRGGRKISPQREGVVHFVGFVILLGVMGIVAFRDIGRILGG